MGAVTFHVPLQSAVVRHPARGSSPHVQCALAPKRLVPPSQGGVHAEPSAGGLAGQTLPGPEPPVPVVEPPVPVPLAPPWPPPVPPVPELAPPPPLVVVLVVVELPVLEVVELEVVVLDPPCPPPPPAWPPFPEDSPRL